MRHLTLQRVKGLAEIDARWAELHREIAAMQIHQEKQQGHVELNIGGYRFQTSAQTLRRVPHTFFDAYFSGRYAQDVCGTASTSGMSWSTCATVTYLWRRLVRGRACPCCGR